MKTIVSLLSIFLIATAHAELPPTVAGEPELISDGYRFTEGPATDSDGNVYFTDQPNNRILEWVPDEGVTTFLEPAGRSNGLYVAADGAIWACADEKNALWRIDPETKAVEVVLKDLGGKLFNGPNDLWIAPDGNVYFTDPLYKRNYWEHREPEAQLPHAVYLLKPDRELMQLEEKFRQPNGIVGTPDGRTLYVADPGVKKIFAFDIGAHGALLNRRVVIESGSDGMTLDADGNIYLTGKEGVSVYNPDGEELGVIPIPQNWTANVTFGGKDGKTLFVTASKAVYAVPMNVAGARLE